MRRWDKQLDTLAITVSKRPACKPGLKNNYPGCSRCLREHVGGASVLQTHSHFVCVGVFLLGSCPFRFHSGVDARVLPISSSEGCPLLSNLCQMDSGREEEEVEEEETKVFRCCRSPSLFQAHFCCLFPVLDLHSLPV